MHAPPKDKPKRNLNGLSILLALPVIYVLSSGPVLGLAFLLRESTGWDGWYSAMFIYYPILALGHGNPLDTYIEWWVVSVFNTVGPG
jgi:hypothetical protein